MLLRPHPTAGRSNPDRIGFGIMAAVLTTFCGCPRGQDVSPVSPPTAPRAAAESVDGTASVPRPPRADDWFEDVTSKSAVAFISRTGEEAGKYTILETVGSGIGLVDFDLDGRADLFCVGGGTIDPQSSRPNGLPCRLYRNYGGWRFDDVTAVASIPAGTGYSHGCLAADFNSDGFPDLFVTCYGRNCLLLNRGDGTYEEVTADAGLDAENWHTAAAVGDVNGDGFLDLFVVSYVDWRPDPDKVCRQGPGQVVDVCPPQDYGPLPDRLFLNSGDGRFVDVTEDFGIRTDGMGLGVVAADLTLNGQVDFYVANDVVANHLYLASDARRAERRQPSDGSSDGQTPHDRRWSYLEQGEVSGTAYNELGSPEGSMGVDAEDVDGDGLPELWVTNFELEDNSLYRNLGAGQFQHATAAFGLGGRCRPLVGFGTGLVDFDGDGRPDLYVLNGHVWYHHGLEPFRQPARLYRNVDGRRIEDVSDAAGPWFSVPHAARGGAVGDLDDDGGLDLVVSSLNAPVALLRNRRPSNNWLRLKLVGTSGPRDPIGAHVTVPAFGRECVRQVKSGAGYLSQSDPRIWFALGEDAAEVDVTVHWPGGRRERFPRLQTGRDHAIIEGTGTD